MLIIFDLDDTLVDTSGFVTPKKLKDALIRMQDAGCQIKDFNVALQALLELNQKAKSSKAALQKFIEIEGISENFFLIGLQEVYESSLGDLAIPALQGATEVLSFLKKENTLALVTIGKIDRQLEKLKKAGIDSSIFYKILCLEDGSKGSSYMELIQDLCIPASNVLVCGDRVEVDLSPAKQMGCTTVHMKRGRGALEQQSHGEIVDFTITHLSQVVDIFLKLSR